MSKLQEEARQLAVLLPHLGERLVKLAQQVDEISEAIFRHEAVRREFLKPTRPAPAPVPAVVPAAANPPAAAAPIASPPVAAPAGAAAPAPVRTFRYALTEAKWSSDRRDIMLQPANGGRTARELMLMLNALPGPALTLKDVQNRRYNGFPGAQAKATQQAKPALLRQTTLPQLACLAEPLAAAPPTQAPAADTDRIATMRAIAAKMGNSGKPKPAPPAPPMTKIAADREQIRSFAARKGWPVQPFDLVAINARCRGVGLPEFVLRAS